MIVYILTFIFMLLVFAGMAIGVIVQGKHIRGSCGGIRCGSCSNVNACEHEKDRPSAIDK